MTIRRLRIPAALLAAASLAGTLPAAPGHIGASTRLHDCGTGTCLLVTGRRLDAAAAVSLAGHDVAVQGGRHWRVDLPLATVRAWSAPFARSILVGVAGRGGGRIDAPLPIGLLGGRTELAFLDISARH